MVSAREYSDTDVVAEEEELQAPHDFDSWYSGFISFLFHLTLIVLIPFLAALAVIEDRQPPEVGTIQVADSSDAAAGDEAESGDESLEFSDRQTTPEEMLSDTAEMQEAVEVEQPDDSDLNLTSTEQAFEETESEFGATRAKARAAVQRARDKLNENLGGTPGGNGSGGSGRAGRASRWILRFNTNSGNEYLRQFGGLGADVALPVGSGYQYFTDLAGSRRRTNKSLASESRIYWIDDDTHHDAARVLGMPGAAHMLAFLPTPLEEKMAQLELAEARQYGVTREEDIQSTIFECVVRGNSFDVQVVAQTRYR